jgi:hypothetical protein
MEQTNGRVQVTQSKRAAIKYHVMNNIPTPTNGLGKGGKK